MSQTVFMRKLRVRRNLSPPACRIRLGIPSTPGLLSGGRWLINFFKKEGVMRSVRRGGEVVVL